MRRAFQNIFFLLLPVLVTSCASSSVIHFDILRPAGFSVPPEIKSVVLVDNSIDFPDTAANIVKVDEEIVKVDTTKVRDYPLHVIKTVGEALNSRLFFDTVYVDTLKHKIFRKGAQLDKLRPEQIDSICRKFGVDAIVSLDAYRYTNEVSVIGVGEFQYYATYDASAINYWRIYLCDHSVLNTHVQKDTIFWEGQGETLNSSVREFPDFKKATYEIGTYLAQKYVDYLSPYWEEVSRRLFTNGNMNFQNATEWINKGNWLEAEKLWNYIYENGSRSAKTKAALNLAVSFERAGDIDHAVEWAYNAYKTMLEKAGGSAKLNIYVMDYYRELTVRRMEKKKLIEQLGEL